jgi:butyryl-CoA dehydrogenase
MPSAFLGRRNLEFVLYELLQTHELTSHEHFADHDRETFDMVLDTADRMARDVLWPSFGAMDRQAPRLEEGRVKVHPAVRDVIQACGSGGWIGAQFPAELGGVQMPGTIMAAFRGILAAANFSASVYPWLTAGAAHLITSFGTPELIDRFVPKMLDGTWQGTMALTEPQAGSSLADVGTQAVPRDDGSYAIKGQKTFISCADHDAVVNVVNLVLARVRGAPEGTKGISLLAVPRLRPEGGELVPNDVTCAGLYHKLGYRGAPIVQLNFGDADDCRGWLVGEENRGLRYMFQMMNEARVEVGMAAAAIASTAYHASLDYCRERVQGRKVTERDPSTPQIPLVEHADVRRMLLFQKAVVEGSLALALQCAAWDDLAHVLDGEQKERCELLLDLLTPVTKTYPAEMGFQAVNQGLQCLGGYGYCEDFPLEQLLRDMRIHPIHEGTTGIQAMDLLGRKVVMKNGQAFVLFMQEMRAAVEQAKATEPLAQMADDLEAAVLELQEVTGGLTAVAVQGRIEAFLADATPFLELFGVVTLAWIWLRQAIVAQRALDDGAAGDEAAFYRSKLHTARYFFAYELPQAGALAAVVANGLGLTLPDQGDVFAD